MMRKKTSKQDEFFFFLVTVSREIRGENFLRRKGKIIWYKTPDEGDDEGWEALILSRALS